MSAVSEKWGIDLLGRKMRYEPWPVTIEGEYRQPREEEIEHVFGVSGEAIEETLLYFEECGGDSEKLIRMLNDHVTDNRFCVNREMLIDPGRFYTNEYYFYFIMFTKRIMNDYGWHFSKGEEIQLSRYHKLYELGFIENIPYGENKGYVTNSVFYAVIKHYSSEGFDFTDFLDWAEAIARHKTNISYKNYVYKLDTYWLEGEFFTYIFHFLMIILNKNSILEMATVCFDSFFLASFSYVPESMLIKMLHYFSKKSSRFHDMELKYTKNNAVYFMMKHQKNTPSLSREYQASSYIIGNWLIIAAFMQIIKKLLKLDELPEVKNIEGIYSNICSFTIQWKKRILTIPYLPLLVSSLASAALLCIDRSYHTGFLVPVILISFFADVLLIVLRRLKIERQKVRIASGHIEKIIEDNNSRLEKAEELSLELMHEKKILEQRVVERTARLAEVNEKLKVLDRAKNDFFANISHELRTPLTLMIGPIESIISGQYGSSLSKDDSLFAMMHFNGSKLLKLINNLLDFAKIEANKMTVKNRKTDIVSLAKFYVSMIKPYVESNGLSIAFNNNSFSASDPDGSIVAWVDRDLLEKAVFNLLSNAVKFTPTGGNIILQLDRNSDSFSIAVKDTGIGIAQDKLTLIFERFIQIDGSSSRKYEGTGIGLPLTKEIIAILGGTITVDSKPGVGSIFTIRLPYGKADPASADDQIEEPGLHTATIRAEFGQTRKLERSSRSHAETGSKQKQKTVLIVEDSSDMQTFLRSLLEKDYSLILAGNGNEGLAKAEANHPDLILADVMMPEMDGYEMTQRIKSQPDLRGIPVVLLTAKADPFMKLEGFDKGADDYVIKPFNADELRARIKAHLEMKSLRDRVARQRDKLQEQQRRIESAIRQKEAAWKIVEEREKRFHEMAEYLPAAIVELDNESNITYVNKIGHELFELTQAEASRKPSFTNLIEPGDRDRFARELGTIAESGNSRLFELRFKTMGNNSFFGLFKFAVLNDENKRTGIRALVTEVRHYLDLVLMPDDRFYEKYGISSREKEVFEYVLKGFANKDTGEKLFISERTVKKHIASILEKTDCARRRDLINLVRESGKSG
jgi:PAS domain S-box-containing protein